MFTGTAPVTGAVGAEMAAIPAPPSLEATSDTLSRLPTSASMGT